MSCSVALQSGMYFLWSKVREFHVFLQALQGEARSKMLKTDGGIINAVGHPVFASILNNAGTHPGLERPLHSVRIFSFMPDKSR